MIAGQHRLLALESTIDDGKLAEDQAWWVADIYNLDSLPKETLIDLAGNVKQVLEPATSGEIFRDMLPVVPYLQARDETPVHRVNISTETTDSYYCGAAFYLRVMADCVLILNYNNAVLRQSYYAKYIITGFPGS